MTLAGAIVYAITPLSSEIWTTVSFEWKVILLSPDKVEELCLLLNEIHVRLEMLKEIAATEPNPEFDWLLEGIKMQEVVILAKLAQQGVKM